MLWLWNKLPNIGDIRLTNKMQSCITMNDVNEMKVLCCKVEQLNVFIDNGNIEQIQIKYIFYA